MKYLHLIWAALFRRKTRTILTLVSIIAAFLLFGMLDAVRTGFDQAGNSANGAERLQTGSRLSFIQTLPQSLEARIAQDPDLVAPRQQPPSDTQLRRDVPATLPQHEQEPAHRCLLPALAGTGPL